MERYFALVRLFIGTPEAEGEMCKGWRPTLAISTIIRGLKTARVQLIEVRFACHQLLVADLGKV